MADNTTPRSSAGKRTAYGSDASAKLPAISGQKKTKKNNNKKKDNTHNVEKILKKRFVNGRAQLYLKWQGYSIDESTWEPIENLSGDCMGLLADFEAQLFAEQCAKARNKTAQDPGTSDNGANVQTETKNTITKRDWRLQKSLANNLNKQKQPKQEQELNLSSSSSDDESITSFKTAIEIKKPSKSSPQQQQQKPQSTPQQQPQSEQQQPQSEQQQPQSEQQQPQSEQQQPQSEQQQPQSEQQQPLSEQQQPLSEEQHQLNHVLPIVLATNKHSLFSEKYEKLLVSMNELNTTATAQTPTLTIEQPAQPTKPAQTNTQHTKSGKTIVHSERSAQTFGPDIPTLTQTIDQAQLKRFAQNIKQTQQTKLAQTIAQPKRPDQTVERPQQIKFAKTYEKMAQATKPAATIEQPTQLSNSAETIEQPTKPAQTVEQQLSTKPAQTVEQQQLTKSTQTIEQLTNTAQTIDKLQPKVVLNVTEFPAQPTKLAQTNKQQVQPNKPAQTIKQPTNSAQTIEQIIEQPQIWQHSKMAKRVSGLVAATASVLIKQVNPLPLSTATPAPLPTPFLSPAPPPLPFLAPTQMPKARAAKTSILRRQTMHDNAIMTSLEQPTTLQMPLNRRRLSLDKSRNRMNNLPPTFQNRSNRRQSVHPSACKTATPKLEIIDKQNTPKVDITDKKVTPKVEFTEVVQQSNSQKLPVALCNNVRLVANTRRSSIMLTTPKTPVQTRLCGDILNSAHSSNSSSSSSQFVSGECWNAELRFSNRAHGIERGLAIEKIVDIFLVRETKYIQIKWQGLTVIDAVPLSDLAKFYPQQLIKYLEKLFLRGHENGLGKFSERINK